MVPGIGPFPFYAFAHVPTLVALRIENQCMAELGHQKSFARHHFHVKGTKRLTGRVRLIYSSHARGIQ